MRPSTHEQKACFTSPVIKHIANLKIMWFVDLSVAVKASPFEVKMVTVTARFGVFQVFIMEECCRFLHARRYWMALSIWINVFARLWYMCPNFSTSKWWHSWQIIWPSIGRILLRKAGCLTLHLESCRDVFPFWINLIGIRVYQLIFTYRVDVFFDPL